MNNAECEQAANEWGGFYLGIVDDARFPSGCIRNKAGDVYFNSHPSGQGQRGWRPIWIKAPDDVFRHFQGEWEGRQGSKLSVSGDVCTFVTGPCAGQRHSISMKDGQPMMNGWIVT